MVSLYGAFGGLEGPSHDAFGANSEGLNDAALRVMYGHLGCEDTAEFRARLSKAGAPLLLVKAECDPIADDNDWLAAHTDHPIHASIGQRSTTCLFASLAAMIGLRGCYGRRSRIGSEAW
jgi:hypothetical protein